MEDKILEGFKNLYLENFITSKLNNVANEFPMSSELIQQQGIAFKSFVDEIDNLYRLYSEIKNLHQGQPVLYIRFTLNHLKIIKDEEKNYKSFTIFKRFVYAFDYPSLSTELKRKFDEGLAILEQSINYFCSYTTKGLPEINSSYRQAVSNVFGIDDKTPEWKKINYIAKLIVRYLNLNGLKFFYDQDSIINGEKIEDKVFDYCGRAVVLVILAQQETFIDSEGEINWCYKEYTHYNATHKDKCHLIVYRIPSLARPAGASKAIKSWYDYISTTDGIRSTKLEYNWTPEMIKNKVDNDADIIVEAYTKVFNNFIEDIS